MCDDDFFGDDFEDNLFDPNDDFQEDLAGDVEDPNAANFDEEAAVHREEAEQEAAFDKADALISDIEENENNDGSPTSSKETTVFDRAAAVMFGSMVAGQAIEEAEDLKHLNRLSKEDKKK